MQQISFLNVFIAKPKSSNAKMSWNLLFGKLPVVASITTHTNTILSLLFLFPLFCFYLFLILHLNTSPLLIGLFLYFLLRSFGFPFNLSNRFVSHCVKTPKTYRSLKVPIPLLRSLHPLFAFRSGTKLRRNFTLPDLENYCQNPFHQSTEFHTALVEI